MPARHEQIGQRAGHQQAMRVLLQAAVAQLGEAEYPLDDPDRMLDPGAHFRLGAVFRPLDLIDDTSVAPRHSRYTHTKSDAQQFFIETSRRNLDCADNRPEVMISLSYIS